MSNILFIGRFQPFHHGHFWVIKKIIDRKAHVLIGIGSSQYHHTATNPFTAKERIEMIETSLKEAGIAKKNYKITCIPDIHKNPEWPAHVRKIIADDFEALYTGRPLVKKLFQQYDTVKIIHLSRYKGFSATRVRHKIIKADESWKEMVPPAVSKIIDKIDGVKRIQECS